MSPKSRRPKATKPGDLHRLLADRGNARDRSNFSDAEAMIATYTLPQVKQFYTSTYGAGRSRLYVVGQIDAAAMAPHELGGAIPHRIGPRVDRLVV